MDSRNMECPIGEQIKLALRQMTPTQRKYMRDYLKGWTYTKIAEKYGCTRQNVSKTIKSAKKQAKYRFKGLLNG